jgi:hypothetical protein
MPNAADIPLVTVVARLQYESSDLDNCSTSRGGIQIPKEFHNWLLTQYVTVPRYSKNIRMTISFYPVEGQLLDA